MSDGLSGWVSAVVAVVAAIFAYRSSRASERSANLAANAQQRAALGRTTALVHAVVEEAGRAESVADHLAQEQRTQQAFSASTGGSRAELAKTQLESNRTDIVSFSNEARSLAQDSSALTNASERDLIDTAARLEGNLVKVRRIREDLEHRWSELAGYNRVIRDERLKQMEKK